MHFVLCNRFLLRSRMFYDRMYAGIKTNEKLMLGKDYTMLVYICEDIKAHLTYLEELLQELSEEMQWSLTIESFENGEELLAALENNVPEVVFADIELPGMDGIELGKEMLRIAPQVCLVLLTAFAEYAIRGYETRAYRYLLKPAKAEEVKQVILDVLARKELDKQLVVRNAEEERLISLRSIRYMKAEDKYIVIRTTEGDFLDRLSLLHYEEILQDTGFFRIHRKYLVNMRYHKAIVEGYVILDNEERLPISRRNVAAYKACFLKMLEGGKLR